MGAAWRERRAFERLYERHHQELYRYCLSILRNREDAEDALQATMASAFRTLTGDRREIAMRPWLFRVAHNESISLLRARRPTTDLEGVAVPSSASAEELVAQRDRLSRLVEDLRSLPERQSSAIVMRELSGLSYAEIGEALSSSEAAARQSVYEGRVALRGLEEGREMECEPVRKALSDRDGRRLRGRKMRAHLDSCNGCGGFAASITQRSSDLGALCPPLPALAAAGILGSLLGSGAHGASSVAAFGGAAATGGAVGAGAGGGLSAVGGGLAGTAAAKGAASLAAIAVAAGAADVGGVINLTHPLRGIDGGSAATVPLGGGSGTESADPTGKAGGLQGGGQGEASRPGQGNVGGPAGGGSPPGGAGSAPGHNGRSHGQSGSAPGRSGTTPGKSGSAPGHSTERPGKSGTAPGHSGTAPGKSDSAPGHDDTSSGKSGSAPGHGSPSVSGSGGKSGFAPGHDVTGGSSGGDSSQSSSGSDAQTAGEAAGGSGSGSTPTSDPSSPQPVKPEKDHVKPTKKS